MLKTLVEQSLDADKAEDIEIIDLRDKTALADYMVVASGRSSRQVAALAEKLLDRLKSVGVENIRIEGKDQSNWVVVDAGDIIIHLFRPEVRGFYNIEKMWSMPQTMDSLPVDGPAAAR
jgi:ribosome-associated protein